MKTSDISLLEASVTGFEAQKGLYIEAAKHHTIVPTEEIIQHKNEYKNWLNEKGKIKPLLLKNEMIIIEGKTADDIWLLGDRLNYLEIHKGFRELGYESMNDMFTDPDFPMEKSKGYNAMAVNKRFTREQCILLGSKINLLISIVRDVDKHELNKIMTQIAKMSYREAYNFLKHYKAFLRGEYDIEEADESTINLSGRGDYKEQVNVTFKMPELKVVKGKKIELKFEEEWEEQVYALALAKLEKRIQQEIANILNSDEYDNYRKLAEKKYED